MIQNWIAETSLPPTRQEICQHFGFRSLTAADDHLKALARKQVIELIPNASRGIRLLTDDVDHNDTNIPVVGRVAAGEPIMSEQHIEEYYQIAANLFSPKADYLLRVRGMSMCDAGILDGDLLAVHSSPVAHNGQIIVARVDDEVTVKRFRKKGDHVTLEAENPDYEAIQVDLSKQDFFIEGIYVGIIRQEESL